MVVAKQMKCARKKIPQISHLFIINLYDSTTAQQVYNTANAKLAYYLQQLDSEIIFFKSVQDHQIFVF